MAVCITWCRGRGISSFQENHITGEMLQNSRVVQGCSHADVTTGSGGPTEGGSGLGKPIPMGAYWASQRRGYSRICVSNWTSSNKTCAFGLLLGQGYCILVYQPWKFGSTVMVWKSAHHQTKTIRYLMEQNAWRHTNPNRRELTRTKGNEICKSNKYEKGALHLFIWRYTISETATNIMYLNREQQKQTNH